MEEESSASEQESELQQTPWQKVMQYWGYVLVGVSAIGIVVIAILLSRSNGLGFNGYMQLTTATQVTLPSMTITRTEVYQPGKTLWDWLQLLIVPFVLAVVGFYFTLINSRNQDKATSRRAEVDHETTVSNQRETALQTYFDKIADLLHNGSLRDAAPNDEARKIARARTLTLLHWLDSVRTGSVIRFLSEIGLLDLVKNDLKRIDLHRADLRQLDLSGIDLSQANLSHVNLSLAILKKVNLDHANMSGANLSGAQLNGAMLSNTNLSQADLSYADLNSIDGRVPDPNNPDGTVITDLSEANLRGAKLIQAHLIGVNLSHADLSGADLSYADLHEAFLTEAILINANLKEVSLEQANLTKADFRNANLEKASLKDANLDGTLITDAQKAMAVPTNPFVGY
jgi:uncharacterized protein YjbI with pentapeptide repeats